MEISGKKAFLPPRELVRGSNIQTLGAWADEWMNATLTDPDGFWLDVARRRVIWRKEPTIGLEGDFHSARRKPLRWFGDGTLNVTETCLDQHLQKHGDKTAIIWEADEPGTGCTLTYRELHEKVCAAACMLYLLGVRRGDRVVIYMGMVPEAAIAMLACARIGAIHSVVFGGFSAESLRDRIIDCGAKLVITQDEGLRGGKIVPLKRTCDQALVDLGQVERVVVFKRTKGEVPWTEGRDVEWKLSDATYFPAEVMEAEDPLFILYTSGSTGKPKGQVHTCGGYLVYASYTHETAFDLRDNDVYACVADVGWITGHTYIVYGPLANGATTLLFESTPTYPDAGRYWDMVDRHSITVFYTAPTAIRVLAAAGDQYVFPYDRSTLRVLGTVGEPINPDAWMWYYKIVGGERCAIVDTWWQTETGGIMISGCPAATPMIPGSATLPLPGILPVIVGADGKPIRSPGTGRLCIAEPWPGMTRTIWRDHERYAATYLEEVPGMYFTSDGCSRDKAGNHTISGRVDDVINVAGHRMGTAEFESVLTADPLVAECAVVGFPHEVKGQGVCAFVVLISTTVPEDLAARLNALLRDKIGAHAKLDVLHIVPGLPKTRSGKCMRRILRAMAKGEDNFGDISTLADPSVVQAIHDIVRAQPSS
ncbi:acetate--CoA ligase [Candidatus Uhrbacteria bacterium]|nr:acetate--CoA ligase [Candidatus Uhrbacteria bacterium]